MLLPLAFTGSAVAGKYDNNGQKGSISVLSKCTLNDDKSLTVETIIMDASSVPGNADLDSMLVQAVGKGAGKWSTATDVGMRTEVENPVFTTDPYFANCVATSCNVVSSVTVITGELIRSLTSSAQCSFKYSLYCATLSK